MKFNIFRPNAPINSHSSNRTGVYIMCKNTKNTKHDRSIGSKRIKYIMLGVLLKK